MTGTARVFGAAATLLITLAWCCCPKADPSNSTQASSSSASGTPDVGPAGPAPWAFTLVEVAANPTARPHTSYERGAVYEYFGFEVPGLMQPSLTRNATSGSAKWYLTDGLPAPGQFAPAGGIRYLAREPIIMGERFLYAIDSGPLAGWFLVADVDSGRIAQIHLANRQYLREPGQLRNIAISANIH